MEAEEAIPAGRFTTMRDYMRSGVVASVVLLMLTGIAAFFYWPLLGYRP